MAGHQTARPRTGLAVAEPGRSTSSHGRPEQQSVPDQNHLGPTAEPGPQDQTGQRRSIRQTLDSGNLILGRLVQINEAWVVGASRRGGAERDKGKVCIKHVPFVGLLGTFCVVLHLDL